MITSLQTTNTEIFAFTAFLVFKLLSNKSFVYKQNRQQKLLKSWLNFKKIANFIGKLHQIYKQLECEIFNTLLKHVSNHLTVFFSIFITVPSSENSNGEIQTNITNRKRPEHCITERYIENQHETPRRKIVPRNCSYTSTTDYGKKIFAGGDIHVKRINKETFNSSF